MTQEEIWKAQEELDIAIEENKKEFARIRELEGYYFIAVGVFIFLSFIVLPIITLIETIWH